MEGFLYWKHVLHQGLEGGVCAPNTSPSAPPPTHTADLGQKLLSLLSEHWKMQDTETSIVCVISELLGGWEVISQLLTHQVGRSKSTV